MKKTYLFTSSLLILAAGTAPAQPLVLEQLHRNGELIWNDISSAFVQATDYHVEWASQVGGGETVWQTFTVVPADNTRYTVEVPMVFRLRAELEGRFPQLKLAVFSDTHYFDSGLLINDGLAFRYYLAADPKLLLESQAILDQMISEVIAAEPDIVLVPGDLTKDGELVCHEAMVGYLAQLEASGAKVFVCPGNHDINNPHALSYDGDTTTPVPTITAPQFAELYADFGFGEAMARDPNSLSYVAEPAPGLWILSMDSCHSELNTESEPFVGGFLDAPRLAWITEQLEAARSQGKYVIGLIHHGVLEHYAGQKTLFPDYVLDDYAAVAELFASHGMELVFTGHYHAQDIAGAEFGRGRRLLDIQTGSPVSYPCPYRLLTLAVNGDLTITSHSIGTIDFDLGGVPFPTYASEYLLAALEDLAIYMLTHPPYDLPLETARFLAPAMAEAFHSHYQGDEETRPISAGTQGILGYLLAQEDPMSQMMANVLLSLFNDPAPDDNALTVNLIPGSPGIVPARALGPHQSRR